MKKIISILIVLLIMISSFSYAEPFEIRSGIAFGMTLEEVEGIEQKNGASIIKKEDYKDYFCLIVETTVAGFDNCHIDYYFDNERGLFKILYHWDEFDGHLYTFEAAEAKQCYTDWNKKYDTIEKILSDKYDIIGKIEGNEVTYFPFRTNVFRCHFLDDPSNPRFDIHGFKQYLIQDNEDYVTALITSFLTKETTLAGTVWNVYFYVDYSHLPKSQYDEIVLTMENEKNKTYNDF